MHVKILTTLSLAALLFIAACDDQGDPVTTNTPVPTVTSVSPDSGKANDTVTVVGTNFGSARGTSTLKFGSSGAAAYVSWNATQIKAVVPTGLTPGSINVTVSVAGNNSNAKTFKSLSAVTLVKFSTDISPLITSYNCASCHPGNGGFSVASYSTIMAGGSRGSTVVAGDTTASFLIKKLRGTLSGGQGSRMPQGGPFMSETEIKKFVDWINQGALNN
ncbi:MAG: IPT/TIG domain-containing protein [Bacteroidota bacterium]